MKRLALILLVSLAGCSSMSSLGRLFPKTYDPVMGDKYVRLNLEVNDLDCKNVEPDKWNIAAFDAKQLAAYSSFRKDPQSDNAASVEKNLNSAMGKAPLVCDGFLKVAKIRLEVINKAWSGR
jgi:hypothetical protein